MAVEASSDVAYATVALPRLICWPVWLNPMDNLHVYTVPYLAHTSRNSSWLNYTCTPNLFNQSKQKRNQRKIETNALIDQNLMWNTDTTSERYKKFLCTSVKLTEMSEFRLFIEWEWRLDYLPVCWAWWGRGPGSWSCLAHPRRLVRTRPEWLPSEEHSRPLWFDSWDRADWRRRRQGQPIHSQS